jgi:hypothetical protein
VIHGTAPQKCARNTLPARSGISVPPEQGFALFDPFFSELRYPQELKTMGGVGEDDKLPLEELVEKLDPFLEKIK